LLVLSANRGGRETTMSLRAKRNFRERIKRGLRADLVKWNATTPPNVAKGAANYRRLLTALRSPGPTILFKAKAAS